MASESDAMIPMPSRSARVVVSMDDDEAKRRLDGLLKSSDLDFEVIEVATDPLDDSVDHEADLVVVHRAEFRDEDLKLIDAYTATESNPDVVVLHEGAEDADRARLRAVGVSFVSDAQDDSDPLHARLAALTQGEGAIVADSRDGEEEPRLEDFHSRSPCMRRFLDLVQRVVDTDSSLLITGETGVGKERLARAIHGEGLRRVGPFVSVNCGAIPEQLLESELFGHEAGAFTGATRRRRGRFEAADGGTIFLDEIGEMPLHLQVSLLTVLQRHRVQRVGSEETVPINVRVMAATNRDLAEEMRAGRFREDLFYRLNVVGLEIPPLRERREDIADLAGSYMNQFRESLSRRRVEGITDEALAALLDWHWPGNVRELVNAIEHCLVVCRSDEINVEDLPQVILQQTERNDLSDSSGSAPAPTPVVPGLKNLFDRPLGEARREATDRFERAYLERLLRETHGRVGETAERAGISTRALFERMRRLNLKKEDFR